MAKLNVGDKRLDDSVEILAEDSLCYQVKAISGNSQGIRTISKALLKEWVEGLRNNPSATSAEMRNSLTGKSNVDRYEYGYNATLYKLAEMVLDVVPYHHAPLSRICQRIVYGAPGAGKSHGINEILVACPDNVIRTTFHPDCDYSTFVGAYKPTMTDGAIGYRFVAQAFTKAYVKAWQLQAAAIQVGAESAEPVYLVIEEINRGNCAQVFGDIFQLLDRKNGYSQYPIKADEDLRQHLADAFEGLSFGPQFAKVQTGEELVLPNNLCIWATMNTSDQSLFPMDSAFKRRWDWKYVPIKNANLGWVIKFGDCEIDWWKFLVKINKVVKSVTNSVDKQLGYFFVKLNEGETEISADMFVNKVVFYLWNDVFKDCELDGDAFKITREDGDGVLAFEDFFKEDGSINEEVLKNFLETLVPAEAPTQGE